MLLGSTWKRSWHAKQMRIGQTVKVSVEHQKHLDALRRAPAYELKHVVPVPFLEIISYDLGEICFPS